MPRWKLRNNGDSNGTITADWITITAHHVVAHEDHDGRDIITGAIPMDKHATVELAKR